MGTAILSLVIQDIYKFVVRNVGTKQYCKII